MKINNKPVHPAVLVALIFLAAGGLVFGAFSWYSRSLLKSADIISALPAGEPHALIKGALRGHPLQLEKVSTPQQRAKGLSGRTTLAPLDGMLFLFDKADYYSFWMKDMHFPIDVVWLDGQMQIIGWSSDLQPNSYPKTFTPPSPARNVLELKAGEVKRLGLQRGDVLELFADTITTQ